MNDDVQHTPLQHLRAIDGNYIPDFITEHEAHALLATIDAGQWRRDLQRRVQHYGYRYDYKARTVGHADTLGDLPAWADGVITKLTAGADPVFPDTPDQIIVNEYEPEQGIAPHTDRNCFGPVVASLSLGGACDIKLSHPDDPETHFSICLKPRSLIFLRGESRNTWKHGLRMKKTAARRVSLTFRTVQRP